jgi:hypothetical protein
MDVLATIWLEYPELQKVIRTHQLPLRLVYTPPVLVSLLYLMRKIGVNLNEFPHVLAEFHDSLGSTFSVATFADDGPPMLGATTWIHSTCEVTDCGLGLDCDCYPACGSQPPARILDVPDDFILLPVANELTKRLQSLDQPVLEYPVCDNTLPLRYVPDIHGRVLAAKETEEVPSSLDTTVEVPEKFNDSAYCSMSLLDYLRLDGEHIAPPDETTPVSVFSSPREDKAHDITRWSLDGDSPAKVAWKKRIGRHVQ